MNNARKRGLRFGGAWLLASLLLCAGCPPGSDGSSVREEGSSELRFFVDPALAASDFEAVVADLLEGELPAGLKRADDRGAADFTLVQTGEQLSLLGPAGRWRSRYSIEAETPRDLANSIRQDLSDHFRQHSLLQQWEGALSIADVSPLDLRFRSDEMAPSHAFDCVRAAWDPQPANSHQPIPMCMPWSLEVELSSELELPLYVGGLLLSADGSVDTLRPDGTALRLDPGRSSVLARGTAVPPLEAMEWILLFGHTDQETVNRATRAAADDSAWKPAASTEWTFGALSYTVIGNSPFLQPDERGDRPREREYTIPRFDIRPYLPARTDSALYRLLVTAHGLWRYRTEAGDGVPYKQHDWVEESDAENLALGIDCSRSTWYAFTRSGLEYTDDMRLGGYLPTGWMVGESSPMAQHFESCDDEPVPRIGDILVYRDPTRNVGHTVMVIDAEKRIAWGSHGWDGVLEEGDQPDTGVEYQLIRKKREWRAWDRSVMERKACWRHRALIAEAGDPGAQAGTYRLDADDACSSRCDEIGASPGE